MIRTPKIWSNYRFWLILVLFAFCTALHYTEFIGISTSSSPGVLPGLSWYTARFLFLLVILYSGFAFGLVAGLVASLAVLAAMLPRALFISTNRLDSLMGVAMVIVVGVVACIWFRMREQEKKRLQQLTTKLEVTQEQLKSHVSDARSNARRMTILNTISDALTQSLEPKNVIAIAINMVAEVMEAEIVLVYSLDTKLGALNLIAHKGISEKSTSELNNIKLGEGFNGRAAASGELLIVDNASHDPRLTRPAVREMRIESQVVVPMKSKGQVIGTICVGMHRPHQFLPEEVELLSTIAGQIASALENAYLYDEARQIADRLYRSVRDYRSLFENAHDAIWFHSSDGIILAANKATEKLTGYDTESLVGMNVSSFLLEGELKLAREVRRMLLAGEAFDQPYEQKLIRKDGSLAASMLTSSLIVLDGQPIGFQHIARDITEEKKMQDNLRFYLQQITQAQEEERKRIARELHDDTAQSLFAISRQIDNFMRDEANLSATHIAFLQGIRHLLGDTLHGVRQFSQDLRPSIIDDLGLIPAVQWLAEQIRGEHNILAELTVLGSQRRFPLEVELILFRIAQEALRNVYRHARASKVEVIIEFKKSSFHMAISDNGKGFQLPKNVGDLSRIGKLGLVGMQERVALLNGSINVESKPSRGTVVSMQAKI
jgi:two-component system sensor histidine kinase DegS